MTDKEYVTILRDEYEQLIRDSLMLDCLDNHGVDNWGGYSDAMNDFNDQMGEE